MIIRPEPLSFFEHQYALVDQVIAGEIDDYPHIPLVLDEFKHQEDLYPKLLLLNLFSPEEKRRLEEQIKEAINARYPATVGVFLQSPVQNAGDFAESLKKKFVLHDGKKYLFRYYDPKVLAQLYWMKPDFFESEMKELVQVWTVAAHNQYYSLEPEFEQSIDKNNIIDAQRLEHIGIINRVLKKQFLHKLPLPEQIEYSKKIDDYIYRAKSYGLSGQTDLMAFSMQSLLAGAYFDEQSSIIKDILTSIKNEQGNASYQKICRNLTLSEWDEIFAQFNLHDQKTKKEIIYV